MIVHGRARWQDAEGCCMLSHFDAIVIGTGQAGPSLAARLCGGMSVAIIERHRFGAPASIPVHPDQDHDRERVCRPNSAPSEHLRVNLGGAVTVDMKAVKARKDAISQGSSRDLEDWCVT